MAQKLGNVAVGTTLKVKENGINQDILIVHQGKPSSLYDESCNGTWILRKEVYEEDTRWSRLTTNGFSNCYVVEQGSNSAWFKSLPANVQNGVKTVKIPYCVGNGRSDIKSGANGFSCKIFALSAPEVGYSSSYSEAVPNDGSKLSYFEAGDSESAKEKRQAKIGSNYRNWWTRSPSILYEQDANAIQSGGGIYLLKVGEYKGGFRPAAILNPNMIVDNNGVITGDILPGPPSFVNVPDSAISGTDLQISWNAVNGVTYQLERSADDSSWETVYTGSETSYQEKAGKWATVKYRIACVKSGILSDYTTSNSIPVIQYIVTSLSVPEQAMEGQPIPIIWDATTQADTFVLEQNLNGGGSWTQLYSGPNKSFNDTAGSWTSVQYRVKAGKDGVFGDYKTSAVIPVVPASALVVSGTDGDLGKLTKDVRYTVTSNTGQPITLDRRVNGLQIASLTVQSGFVYDIPVMELPTGTGTIKITAKVKPPGSSEVTVVRSWTYTKDAQIFPADGGGGVVKNDDKTVLPLTIAECVRVPKNWGGSLDKALEKLQYSVDPLRIITGTYAGTGTFGQATPNTIPVPFKPYLAFIGDTADNTIATVCMIRGRLSVVTRLSNPLRIINPTWSDASLSWYGATAEGQMNVTGRNYTYVIIGQ